MLRHAVAPLSVLFVSSNIMVGSAHAQDVSACLVTSVDTSPFFAKVREGAETKAQELGITLTVPGGMDGNIMSQVAAVESCVAIGATGILITAVDASAIVPTINMARDAGVLVIALDTPLNPIDAADATFATDHFLAGEAIGSWAAQRLGHGAGDARVGFLDLDESHPPIDVLRNQGFMEGFGIANNDLNVIGDEFDERIVGHEVTNGNSQGGHDAMQRLLQKESSLDVVYTINESVAAGAHEALTATGRDDVLIVSFGGSCQGIENVANGSISATVMEFPLDMGSKGIEAIAQLAEGGSIPQNTEGLDFVASRIDVTTQMPVPDCDVTPELCQPTDPQSALDLCWGD